MNAFRILARAVLLSALALVGSQPIWAEQTIQVLPNCPSDLTNMCFGHVSANGHGASSAAAEANAVTAFGQALAQMSPKCPRKCPGLTRCDREIQAHGGGPIPVTVTEGEWDQLTGFYHSTATAEDFCIDIHCDPC